MPIPFVFSYSEVPLNVADSFSSGHALFLSSHWIDSSTVTASSSEGLLTVDHVQTIRPDQVWRATGYTAEWLAWDFGSSRVVEAVVILAHNLSANATLRVRLAATEADVTADPALDTDIQSAWPASGKPDEPGESPFSLLLLDNAEAYRYGRIDIADPANLDGYVQVGRLFAGPAFVPAINVDINPTIGLISPDEAGRTAFGHTFGDNRGPAARIFQVPMSAVSSSELSFEIFELQRYCGLAKDFAFCLDPLADVLFHQVSAQVRFSSMTSFQAQPAFNEDGEQVWQTTLALEEIL